MNTLLFLQAISDMIVQAINSSEANENGNYIERGLAEMSKEGQCFNSKNGLKFIQSQLTDMFIAGTDTTSSTCEWSLAYLVHFPEWQEKIHEEIANLTNGNERRVQLQDKSKAHLLNAFVEETMRHCPAGNEKIRKNALSDGKIKMYPSLSDN